MVPTGSRAARSAPVSRTLIIVAVLFYLIGSLGDMRLTLLENFAQLNLLVADGEWWRIFTPVLLHAGLTHILFNMWALWVLGPQIERGVGPWPFLGLYLASAGVGGAFYYFLGPPAVIAVGASGAIFGLFGVWLNWAVHRRNTAHGQALLRQIGFLLLLNAALPFILGGIAWEAHLGGLIAGFVIGEAWSRLRGGNKEWARVAVTAVVAVAAVLAVVLIPPGF